MATSVASLSLAIVQGIRCVTYRQAEAATKQLAAQLVGAFGAAELSRFRYAAIPRGGLFVLGMLSYVLDLTSEALLSSAADVPLVVVDDAAYSGARFAEFLSTVANQEVIFAHLYSHPDLRAAILRQEPRVVACLAAHDLRDLAPERCAPESEYLAWKERWRQRARRLVYWMGLPEMVIFPWSEPDRPVWNPEAERVEEGWWLTAPDRCLKNWARLGIPPSAQAQPTLRSPDGVAFHFDGDKIVLCDLRTELVYGLEGVAADMWRALVGYGDLRVAAEYLVSCYEVDEQKLWSDLQTFADELLSKGLLEWIDEPSDSE
ncbi:MAG: PqqD family protein [Chloroflexi bacterium]|nr:PqqD family protein [Chloroflexota bacterium]